jgi:hypothetical protein
VLNPHAESSGSASAMTRKAGSGRSVASEKICLESMEYPLEARWLMDSLTQSRDKKTAAPPLLL